MGKRMGRTRIGRRGMGRTRMRRRRMGRRRPGSLIKQRNNKSYRQMFI
jgi:hypothetical protein